MQLKDIYKPIRKELTKVEEKLHHELGRQNGFIAEISRYVLRAPGKRLRPALVLFSSKINPHPSAGAVDLAAAIELIHTATLVQDDVVDQAKLRRGKITVAKKWGGNLALLFGDYLYAVAFGLLSRLRNSSVLHSLSEVTTTMAAGEMEQLYRRGEKISAETYFEIIEKKTAALFAVCCEAGAVLSDATTVEIKALKEFGLNFGMAFQIMDDCLDHSFSAKELGKSSGLDQKMGKVTLPVIYNSLEKAEEKARDYMGQAQKILEEKFPPLKTNPLVELGSYVLGQI